MDMCLKSKEPVHFAQPILSNNYGNSCTLLQSGLRWVLETTTRPSLPDPAKSAEDDIVCRAFVTISTVLTHCREDLPGYCQQFKRVAWVSHVFRKAMVNHNAQAWVDGLKDSASWTLLQPQRRR